MSLRNSDSLLERKYMKIYEKKNALKKRSKKAYFINVNFKSVFFGTINF